MRIVFFGPPGSGKGTQAERVQRQWGVPHLSTGEMLRQARSERTPVGKLASEYLDAGRLVPDDVILTMVRERLQQEDCEGGYLLDGFPRTVDQAVALEEWLARSGAALDAVLSLTVPEELLVTRLLDRGRGDDSQETILRRFHDFQTQTAPLLEYYRQRRLLHEIEGTGTPQEVFSRIRGVLDRIGGTAGNLSDERCGA